MSTVEQLKPTPVRTADRVTEGARGWWDNSRGFLTEVRNEMRRVTWPSRREVYATTVVVILTSAFFGVYLWGLDLVIGRAIEWVYRSFGAA
jgi:preprotein translocase subunit SecE